MPRMFARSVAALTCLCIVFHGPIPSSGTELCAANVGCDEVGGRATVMLQHKAATARAERTVVSDTMLERGADMSSVHQGNAPKEGEGGHSDPHYTLHGCRCKDVWNYKGNTAKACSEIESDHAEKWPWCQVEGECEKPAGKAKDGTMWDYCALDKEVTHTRTQHGCHCNPHFEYNNTIYNGCSKTSLGPKWCYVFETDQLCPESLRTEHHGLHWDYCFTPDQSPIYLTRNGCHCMPEYWVGEELHKGCSTFKVEGKEMQACVILEDDTLCNGAVKLSKESSHSVDECSVTLEKEVAQLKTIVSTIDKRCSCQPKWDHKGKEYAGCAKTSDRDRKWCFVLQDSRACPEVDGVEKEAKSVQRWRYCDPSEGSTVPANGETLALRRKRVVPGAEAVESNSSKPQSGRVQVVPVIVPIADSLPQQVPASSSVVPANGQLPASYRVVPVIVPVADGGRPKNLAPRLEEGPKEEPEPSSEAPSH